MSAYTPMLLSRYDRLDNSRNGNPRYKFYWGDGTDSLSSSDHSFCYSIGNPGFRPGDTVYVKWTKAGRVEDMCTPAEYRNRQGA